MLTDIEYETCILILALWTPDYHWPLKDIVLLSWRKVCSNVAIQNRACCIMSHHKGSVKR